jgi:hypothetical protein
MGVFGKYVADNKEEMQSQFIILENDTIIDTDDIKPEGITEITKEFEEDGKVHTTIRKQYEFLNGKIMEVPISVHRKMMILYSEYEKDGTIITRFKVKKEGSGKSTKYDVLAILPKQNTHGADKIIRGGSQ